jgi:hypothetical protein
VFFEPFDTSLDGLTVLLPPACERDEITTVRAVSDIGQYVAPLANALS